MNQRTRKNEPVNSVVRSSESRANSRIDLAEVKVL